jgi:hypothetical protein
MANLVPCLKKILALDACIFSGQEGAHWLKSGPQWRLPILLSFAYMSLLIYETWCFPSWIVRLVESPTLG